jgi:hypothetical protein
VPNPVILVSSCFRDKKNGNQQIVRDTWASKSSIPVFFLLGKSINSADREDEILVDAPDDYFGLPFKTQQGKRWARAHGYDFVFQCFVDTYVVPERLAASGFQNFNYSGNESEIYGFANEKYTFCHGGPGYWNGPKAIEVIINAPIELKRFEWHKWEDQWAGHTLRRAGIRPRDDKRYSMGTSYQKREAVALPDNDVISEHLSSVTGIYDKDWMIQADHQRHGRTFRPKVIKLPGCNCEACIAEAKRKGLAFTTPSPAPPTVVGRPRDVLPAGIFRPPAPR